MKNETESVAAPSVSLTVSTLCKFIIKKVLT